MKRIYHTWDKWECYPAGFYETRPPSKTMTDDECRDAYAEFLADLPRFEKALEGVTREWVKSCEHYLTNERMNRIAWLGQSAMCFETRVPSIYSGGFNRLSEEQQAAANEMALKYLNAWLAEHGEPPVTMDQAASKTKMNLY